MVHAAGDGAAALNLGFFHDDDARTLFRRAHRHEEAGEAAAHDGDIRLNHVLHANFFSYSYLETRSRKLHQPTGADCTCS